MRNHLKRAAKASGAYAFLRETEVLAAAVLRRVHDQDYKQIPSLSPGAILDIGANLGQSLASFRALFRGRPIVSFEPNPTCIPSLQRVARVLGGDIQIRNIGLGAEAGEFDFYVPVVDGVEMLQDASFNLQAFAHPETAKRLGANFQIRSQRISVSTVDSMNLSPALMKIDVQGLELAVIKGALSTIERSRPIVLVERDGQSEPAIDALLAPIGYQGRDMYINRLYIPG